MASLLLVGMGGILNTPSEDREGGCCMLFSEKGGKSDSYSEATSFLGGKKVVGFSKSAEL
jgi:hypothetical protein